jgi:membrane associated rhomboid family serine protease
VILIPIGRDDAEIRRHAWVSYVIIALNVLAFVAVETASRTSKMVAIQAELEKTARYLMERPYLEVPPALADMIGERDMKKIEKERRALASQTHAPVRRVREREQAELDEMAAEVIKSIRGLPHIRFGYIPAEGSFLTMVTSMFIHAGLLHLLGNMLFFFVSGPFIEDVFGRPLFAALYVAGGFAASWTYASKHPDGDIPLVGASGAIAAVMGAYLVRFFRSKVEFLFIPIIFRPHLFFRFFLPAFVVLPLWFIEQWLEMQSESAGGGVAFSAHVGGFVFGAVIAVIVKAVGFEEKFVDPTVEKETTWSMDPRTLAAMARLRDAQAMDDYAAIDTAATTLLARYVEEKQDDLAEELIHDVTANRDARLPRFLPRAAAFAERKRDRDWALTLYERIYKIDPNSGAAVQSLVKIGTLLRLNGDMRGARETLVKARAHPACTPEWAPTIDAKIAQLDGQPTAPAPAPRPASSIRQ